MCVYHRHNMVNTIIILWLSMSAMYQFKLNKYE